MAKPRKPIPKSQLTLSEKKHTPFRGREEQGIQSNPNDAEIPNNPNYTETGIQHNRSAQMSFKDDDTKQFSVGDGYYRDKKGAIMLPIIVIKRDSITKDRTVANKLDANMPNLTGVFSKEFSSKNFYSNFGTLNNRIPVNKFHVVAQPDYVTMEYSCLIQTYYMEQLNKIVEACEYGSDAYWGNPERYMFRSFIDSFNTATELTVNKDRLVTGTFNIRLRGYLIPDTIQKDLNSTKMYNSKAKVTITTETVSDVEGAGIPTQNPTTDHRSRD